ncbi:MAG: hypothetical protein IT561_00885 [Alphaproteobacteria bacterium]|nr:hypothetical protein [Alphaproteobacteria bacterium]
MRMLLLAMAVGIAGCAAETSDLILEHKNNEVTVKLVDGDAAAAKRAADSACGVERKRAVLSGVSADRMKFFCDRWY